MKEMTNDRLLFHAAERLDRARGIVQEAWATGVLEPTAAGELVRDLNQAQAAALELERRAMEAAKQAKG